MSPVAELRADLPDPRLCRWFGIGFVVLPSLLLAAHHLETRAETWSLPSLWGLGLAGLCLNFALCYSARLRVGVAPTGQGLTVERRLLGATWRIDRVPFGEIEAVWLAWDRRGMLDGVLFPWRTGRPVTLERYDKLPLLVGLWDNAVSAEGWAAYLSQQIGCRIRGVTVERQAAEAADLPYVPRRLASIVYRRSGSLRIRLARDADAATYPKTSRLHATVALSMPVIMLFAWITNDVPCLEILIFLPIVVLFSLSVVFGGGTSGRPDIVVEPGSLEILRRRLSGRPETWEWSGEDRPEIEVVRAGWRLRKRALRILSRSGEGERRRLLIGHGFPEDQLIWIQEALRRVLYSTEPLPKVRQPLVDVSTHQVPLKDGQFTGFWSPEVVTIMLSIVLLISGAWLSWKGWLT